MKTKYIDCNNNTPTEIVEFLNNIGIEAHQEELPDNVFNRLIHFSIYGIDYKIIWYSNQSTLQIGENIRPAQIPFRYIYLDETFPLIGGNVSIGFAYKKNEVKSIIDRPFQYDLLRIPLELKQNS